jgi:peptidoglycan/LPS O-acetylase OafA/YrhL
MLSTLASLTDRGANRFGLLRLLLALGVVLSHAATIGGLGSERLTAATTETWGRLSVYGFFVLSGFLVAHSYERGGLFRYVWHRALRIWPGFLVALAVVGFGFVAVERAARGASFDGHAAAAWRFVAQNAGVRVRAFGVDGTLVDVPYPSIWIGSCWSLIHECKGYALVAGLGLLSLLRRGPWPPTLVFVAAHAAHAVELRAPGAVQQRAPFHIDPPLFALLPWFFAGVAAWSWRERIPRSPTLAWAALAASALALFAAPALFPVLAVVPLSYALLVAAGGARGRGVGARWDLSYGVFLDGFPVQQLLAVAGAQRLGYIAFAALSVAATLPFAAFSWRCVEAPSLRAKNWRPWARGVRDGGSPA